MKQIIHVLGLSIAVACSAVSASAQELQTPLNGEGRPPLCGDGSCGEGENRANCPEDCAIITCGNKLCEEGENERNCPEDCAPVVETGPFCGDGKCNNYEDRFSCVRDCSENQIEESPCQATFQFVIVERNAHNPDWQLFKHRHDPTLCQLVESACGNDPEFLMSISCNTYAEVCKDTEIMCE